MGENYFPRLSRSLIKIEWQFIKQIFQPDKMCIMKKSTVVFIIVGFFVFAEVFAADLPKLPNVIVPVFKKDSFNIKNYGAKADGISLNTKSINAAIAACNKKGGGVVVV